MYKMRLLAANIHCKSNQHLITSTLQPYINAVGTALPPGGQNVSRQLLLVLCIVQGILAEHSRLVPTNPLHAKRIPLHSPFHAADNKPI